MAKNDGMTGTVAYMRKDTHFLADGVWYITTPCERCGLVDEAVSWDEAKTPHHAGRIADMRHADCMRIENDHEIALAGLAEIHAAEELLANQERNYQAWSERVEALRMAVNEQPDVKLLHRELDAAEQQFALHKKGLFEAQRRLQETKAANEG